MGSLTLYDYGVIIGGLILTGVTCFVALAFWALWPQPWRGIAHAFSYLFGYFVSTVYVEPRFDWGSVNDEDYVNGWADEEADAQTDAQTDVGLSALEEAVQKKRHDIIRSLIIDTLVEAGAGADICRQLLKGDNGKTGAEVEAAKERLGISPPSRKLLVRDNGEPAREIAFDRS